MDESSGSKPRWEEVKNGKVVIMVQPVPPCKFSNHFVPQMANCWNPFLLHTKLLKAGNHGDKIHCSRTKKMTEHKFRPSPVQWNLQQACCFSQCNLFGTVTNFVCAFATKWNKLLVQGRTNHVACKSKTKCSPGTPCQQCCWWQFLSQIAEQLIFFWSAQSFDATETQPIAQPITFDQRLSLSHIFEIGRQQAQIWPMQSNLLVMINLLPICHWTPLQQHLPAKTHPSCQQWQRQWLCWVGP